MGYRGYPRNDVIWTIIGANILVFLTMLVVPRVENLFALSLAGFPSHPWTIVTSLFTHAGPSHIILNMLTLYFFGSFLFALVGETQFLIIYFGAGILGNILFMALALLGGMLHSGFLGSPFDAVVGASGAIFGLGGALAVLRPNEKVLLYFLIPVPMWLAVIIGVLLVSPGVAWQAHLGGLLFGLAAGYWIKRRGRYYFQD